MLRRIQEAASLGAKRPVLDVLIREPGPHRLAEEQHVANVVPRVWVEHTLEIGRDAAWAQFLEEADQRV